MSAIENALLEGTIFIRKFFKTFHALVFRPTEVLNNINPTKYGTDKLFNPFLFYVISTLPTVFIFSCQSSDFNTLSRDLPIFFNNLTIPKIFLITLPYMVIGYCIAITGSLLFKSKEWKTAYKSYIYYSLSLPLLAFASVAGTQALINHLIFHDFFYGKWEQFAGFLLILVFILIGLIIPMSASWSEKWGSLKKRWIFTLTPILGLTTFIICLAFVHNRIGYQKGYTVLPDDIICEEIDVHNFTPEIRMSFTSKTLYFEYTLWFYNPTGRIFWIPAEFGVDLLSADYYNDKEMRKKYPILNFESIILKGHQRDSLLIKPNQTKKIEYKCLLNRNIMDSSFLNTLLKKNGGYYKSQISMAYQDILKNPYNKNENCDVSLVFDSTIAHLWPMDSLRLKH